MEFLYIILGWLFGLLTSPISFRIERELKRKDLKFAINSELKNLATRLGSVFYKINSHLGTLDKPSLVWVRDVYKKHNSEMLTPGMEKIFEASDEEFKIVISSYKGAENIALSLKTFSLPVMDSLLGDISIFDSAFQRKILELRSKKSKSFCWGRCTSWSICECWC